MSSLCSKRALSEIQSGFTTLAAGWQVIENSCPHDGTVFILRLADMVYWTSIHSKHLMYKITTFPYKISKWMSEVIIRWPYGISEYVNAEKLLRNRMTPGKFSPSTHPYHWNLESFPERSRAPMRRKSGAGKKSWIWERKRVLSFVSIEAQHRYT